MKTAIRSTRYTIDEVKALADRIEELAQDYRPTVSRVHTMAPMLMSHGFSFFEPLSTKMFIVIDIVKKYPIILDEYLSTVPSNIVSLQLLWADIAEHIPDTIIKECFLRAHVTWFEISDRDLVIISNRYTEDELVNLWLDNRLESQSDYKSSSKESEGFTVRSKMND